MSDTVGRIDLILDIDGKRAIGKIRKAGEQAGAEAGEGFNDEFGDVVTKGAASRNKELGKEGRKAGESYADARDNILRDRNKKFSRNLANVFETPKGLSDYVNKFDDARTAYKQLRFEMKELHKANLITKEDFDRNNETLRNTYRQVYRAKDRANELAAAQNRLNRDWEEAIRVNRQYDQAVRRHDQSVRSAQRSMSEWSRQIAQGVRDQERFSRELDRTRTSVATVFRDGDKGIARYVRRFPEAHEGINRLQGDLLRLRNANRITDNEFERGFHSLDQYTRRARALGEGFTEVERSSTRAGNGIRRFNRNGAQMPYFLKTIVGYTALFTALAPGIAVLGSAAGSGALALATGAGALGLAVVTLIPAFKGMLGDISKLPAEARPAAKALQAMKQPLGDIQDTIQKGVWSGLGPDIENLTKKVFPRLEKGFGQTAKTINGLFRDMISGLTSRDALGRMDTIFTGLQPILQSLGRATLSLGGAFSKLFAAALPSGQGFAKFLENILRDWNAWLSSTEGTKALTEFFDHLDVVMPRVGNLIGAAGKAISSLVTDDAVNNMATFLDKMTVAVPQVVGGLGGLVDAVDPLGLAASAVQGIGDWFSRNSGPVQKFGDAANSLLGKGGSTIGTILSQVADAVIGISPEVFEGLGKGFDAIKDAVSKPEFGSALKSVAKALGAAGKAVGDLLDALDKTGAISVAFGVIENAADAAAGALTAFSAAAKAVSGDIKGAKKDLDSIKNMQSDNESKNDQKNKDFRKQNGDFWGDVLLGPTNEDLKKGLEKQRKSTGPSLWTSGLLNIWAEQVAKDKQKAKDKGSEGGAKLGGSFADGVNEGSTKGSSGAKVATAGTTLSGTFLSKLGTAFTQGLPALALGDKLALPFQGVPTKIGEFVQNVPGVIGGILGGLGVQGQDGANKTQNPFGSVGTGIGGLVGPVPGIIGGIMNLISGQPGADRTKNPFNGVDGDIGSKVAGAPGIIGGIMNLISGQPGADKTVTPFNGVSGDIRSKVNPVPGVISAALSGISDFGAAGRIVSAFQGVPGLVGAALSGLAGVVQRALSAAKSALNAGIGALNAGTAGGAANIPRTAIGGTFNGAQMRIIAEAGPEAVVPLNRPLSQVDPSVRALSAIAQGKFPLTGGATNGKSVVVESGAIMFSAPNSDPEQVASAMLDRLISNL